MVEEWGGTIAVAAVAALLGGLWLAARPLRARPSRARNAAALPSRTGTAAEALLRVVRSELERGRSEAAVAHWISLGAAGLEAHADPMLAIRMAGLLRDGGRGSEAAAALRSALSRSDGPDGLAIATRVARAAVDLDSDLAADAAGRALASDALDPLDRRDLELLLAALPGDPATPSGDDPCAAAAPAPPPDAPPAPVPDEVPAPVPDEVPAPVPGEARARPEPIELAQTRRLEVSLAVPLAIELAGLRVALDGGESRVLSWRETDAIAVGAIEGLGPKPVLVVDLVAGWREPASQPLRIVRLRGDRFDPRKLVSSQVSPVDALRELVDRLLGETGAAPLPDLRAARGRPFAGFRDLTAFEEDVLGSEEGGSAVERGSP